MIGSAALCLLLIPQFNLTATLEPTSEQVVAFSKSIDMVFADSFARAYDIVEGMPDTVSGKPIYHLIYASVMHADMLDAEDFSREKIFFAHIDTSINLLEKWVDGNPDDPWGLFFLGTSYGYKSMLYAQQRRWLKSMIDGLKARGKFSKAIELDSTLYDAYTGIGNYHYWSTVKLGKYVPFLPDNRDRGISELQLAKDSSLFSRLPAQAGLAWALIQEKKLRQAIQLGNRMKEETGGGRNSLWILGGSYWRTGELNLAAEYYDNLIDSFIKAGNQNYYNLIFCRYRRGVCLFKMKKYKEAKMELETLLSYDVSRDVKKRHKKTYENTRDYLKKIDKNFSEIRKSF